MTQIQLRRDIASNWTNANPILAQGEIGVDTTSKRFKLGDGTTPWKDLSFYDELYIRAAVDGKEDRFTVDAPLSLNILENLPKNISSVSGGSYQYLNKVAYNITGFSPVMQAAGRSVTFFGTTGTSTTEYPTLMSDAYLMVKRNFAIGDTISGLLDRRADTSAGIFAPMVFGYLSSDNKFEPKITVDFYGSSYRVLSLTGAPSISHPTSTRTIVSRTMTTVQSFNGNPVDQIKVVAGTTEGTFYLELKDENGVNLTPRTESPASYFNLSEINCAIYQAKCYQEEPNATIQGFKKYDKTYVKNIAGEIVWSIGDVTKDKHLGVKVSQEADNTLQIKPDGLYVPTPATGNSNYGIKGDYSTHYGILECPDGILTYTGKEVTLKQGVVLQCAGSEIKTTIATNIVKTLTSTTPIVLFYAGGELLECGKVDYQDTEPTDDGVTNYQAWFKPSEQQWYLKSNDTGNVFRAIEATPIANINLNTENITRVDYIGYRLLDDDIIVSKNHLEDIVDKQTIQVVSGKLTCNLNELGNEVNTLANRVSTLETRTSNTENDITAINTALGDLMFVKCTQAEYDGLATKDASTLYIITGA